MPKTTPSLDPRAAFALPDFIDGTQACADADPELFFPTKGQVLTKALDFCRVCELELACGDWALRTRQAFGVYGGMTATARYAILRDAKALA